MTCPLCGGGEAGLLHEERDRRWFQCPACALVFLDPALRLSPDDERARYSEHNNDAADPGYRSFLARLAAPVLERVAPGSRGLDYGSGPVPALAALLIDAGLQCESYDPYFQADTTALAARYDFVTCCEVAEHAYNPAKLFDTLGRLVMPSGLIAVMTSFYDSARPFGEWWYRRDPTHVCFYSPATMQWIAGRRGWQLELPAPHIALFRVP